MKNIIFSIFLILITSCKNKEAKVQEISDNTSKEKSFEKIKVENLNLHLICLSEIKKETVIFNSCDAGNAEIYVYTFNDSSYILLTGTQEDELYLVKETYKLESDTIYFKVNYYGSEKEGLIKYIITDSFKGISKWQIKALDMNYSLTFVEEQKKNNFKTIEQPCKECWEEEGICEETAIKDSIEKNEKPIETIERLSNFWRAEAWDFYDYPSSKEIKENLNKIKSITSKDSKILIQTYLNCDERDKDLKKNIVLKLKSNQKVSNEELKKFKIDNLSKQKLTELKELLNSTSKLKYS